MSKEEKKYLSLLGYILRANNDDSCPYFINELKA